MYFEGDTPIYHRTWFKVLLNPILRKIQFWTDQPYVIVSKVKDKKVTGYGFQRVRLMKGG